MFSVEIPKVTFLIVFTIYLSITNFRGERFILAQDLMGDDPSGQKKKKKKIMAGISLAFVCTEAAHISAGQEAGRRQIPQVLPLLTCFLHLGSTSCRFYNLPRKTAIWDVRLQGPFHIKMLIDLCQLLSSGDISWCIHGPSVLHTHLPLR